MTEGVALVCWSRVAVALALPWRALGHVACPQLYDEGDHLMRMPGCRGCYVEARAAGGSVHRNTSQTACLCSQLWVLWVNSSTVPAESESTEYQCDWLGRRRLCSACTVGRAESLWLPWTCPREGTRCRVAHCNQPSWGAERLPRSVCVLNHHALFSPVVSQVEPKPRLSLSLGPPAKAGSQPCMCGLAPERPSSQSTVEEPPVDLPQLLSAGQKDAAMVCR